MLERTEQWKASTRHALRDSLTRALVLAALAGLAVAVALGVHHDGDADDLAAAAVFAAFAVGLGIVGIRTFVGEHVRSDEHEPRAHVRR